VSKYVQGILSIFQIPLFSKAWILVLFSILLQKDEITVVIVACFSYCLFRDAFPCEQQFSIVSKYIVDHTQTANVKVRQMTVCHPYLHIHFICLSVFQCLSVCLSLCLFCYVSVVTIQYDTIICNAHKVEYRTSNLRREQSLGGRGYGRWLTGMRCEECFKTVFECM